MKKVFAASTSGAMASTMFENTVPVMKSTLSRRRKRSTSCLAFSGLSWSSPTSTSAGTPPSLPPLSFSARLKPSRMSPPIAAFGPDSVLTNPTFTLSAASAARTKRRIATKNSFLMISTRLPGDLHSGIDDAPVLDDPAPIELHRAVAHRHVAMPARIVLASALGIRARGEQEVAGESPGRGAVALRRVAVQGDAVPERLRVHSPAEVRHRIRVAVLGRRFPVLQPVAHQLRVHRALDLDDMALADLEPHRIRNIAAIRQDHDVPGLQHHRAVGAAFVRERVDVPAAPMVEVRALVGVSPLRHHRVFAALVGQVGSGLAADPYGFGFPV